MNKILDKWQQNGQQRVCNFKLVNEKWPASMTNDMCDMKLIEQKWMWEQLKFTQIMISSDYMKTN